MDFIDSLKLIIGACGLFGIAPYKIRKSNHRNLLVKSPGKSGYTKIAFCFLITTAVIFLFDLSDHYNALFRFASKTAKTLFFYVFFVNAATVYLTILGKADSIVNGVNLVNEPCPKKTCAFGPKLLLTYTVLHFSANVGSFQTVVFREDSPSKTFQWFALAFWSWPEDLLVAQILHFVNVTSVKCEQINQKLKNNFKNFRSLRKTLWELRELRAEDEVVKNFVDTLNEVFGMNLLWYILQLFLSSVSISYELILNTQINLLHLLGFLLYVMARLSLMLRIFEYTKREAEKTANHVHDLFMENDDPEIKEEIEIFSLQLQHRKVEFNACGFFKLDFTLLYSMIGAVTTYIIILMQFQKEDPTSVEWRSKKITNCSLLLHHFTVSEVFRCINTSIVHE